MTERAASKRPRLSSNIALDAVLLFAALAVAASMSWNMYFERDLRSGSDLAAERSSLAFGLVEESRASLGSSEVEGSGPYVVRRVAQSAREEFVAALKDRLDRPDAPPPRQGDAAPSVAAGSEAVAALIDSAAVHLSFIGPLIAADDRRLGAELRAAGWVIGDPVQTAPRLLHGDGSSIVQPGPAEQDLAVGLEDLPSSQTPAAAAAPSELADGNEAHRRELGGQAAEADRTDEALSGEAAPPAARTPIARPERGQAEAPRAKRAKAAAPRVKRAKAAAPRTGRTPPQERAGGERRYVRSFAEERRNRTVSAQVIEDLSAQSGPTPSLPPSLLPTLPGRGP